MKRVMILSVVFACLVALPAGADVYFHAGFESSEGFDGGDVVGQNDWGTVKNYSTVRDVVTGPLTPTEGEQMLKLTTDPKAAGATKQWSETTQTHFALSVDMAFSISGDAPEGGFGYMVMYAQDTGLWSGFRFGFACEDGNYYATYRDGTVLKTVSMDPLQADTFYTFKVTVDGSTSTAKYSLEVLDSLGSSLAYEDDISANAGRRDFDSVFLYATAGSETSERTLYVDNLTIVPEPGSLCLVAIGGLITCLRRRK